MTDPVQRVAVAIVQFEGRFLIGRRPGNVALAGLWEFPGGKIEGAESPEAAAERECHEETGIVVEADRLFAEVQHEYATSGGAPLAVHLHFVACRPRKPCAAPRDPFRWVAAHDLRDYAFPAANEAVIDRLVAEPGGGESFSV